MTGIVDDHKEIKVRNVSGEICFGTIIKFIARFASFAGAFVLFAFLFTGVNKFAQSSLNQIKQSPRS